MFQFSKRRSFQCFSCEKIVWQYFCSFFVQILNKKNLRLFKRKCLFSAPSLSRSAASSPYWSWSPSPPPTMPGTPTPGQLRVHHAMMIDQLTVSFSVAAPVLFKSSSALPPGFLNPSSVSSIFFVICPKSFI